MSESAITIADLRARLEAVTKELDEARRWSWAWKRTAKSRAGELRLWESGAFDCAICAQAGTSNGVCRACMVGKSPVKLAWKERDAANARAEAAEAEVERSRLVWMDRDAALSQLSAALAQAATAEGQVAALRFQLERAIRAGGLHSAAFDAVLADTAKAAQEHDARTAATARREALEEAAEYVRDVWEQWISRTGLPDAIRALAAEKESGKL